MGAPRRGPSAAGTVCPSCAGGPGTRLLPSCCWILLQLLAARADAPHSGATGLPRSRARARISWKVPALGSGSTPQGPSCPSTPPRPGPLCQPCRTFIHPFVCLQGQGMGSGEQERVRSGPFRRTAPWQLLSFFTFEASQGLYHHPSKHLQYAASLPNVLLYELGGETEA